MRLPEICGPIIGQQASRLAVDRRMERELPIRRSAMPDDKTRRGPADRSRINVNEPYELDYWSKEFDLTPEQLRQLGGKARYVS